MIFTRERELEAEVTKLQKKLKTVEVDRLMMEKYLGKKGLIDDYVKMAEKEILEVQTDILRRRLKVVEPK